MRAQDLTPSHPRHIGLQRFGVRLMALQPHMNAVAVAKRAVDAFRDSADLEPEVAADRSYAEDLSDEDDASE